MMIRYLNNFKKRCLELIVVILIVSCAGTSGGVIPIIEDDAQASTSSPSVFIITGLPNNIGFGEEYTLKLQLNGVDVIDSTGALKSEYTSLKWFSSNINVATMEESTGKVTTVAKGEAEIHAFLTEAGATEKKVASLKIAVGAKDLANLTAFNYGTLNNTSKRYEITSVIETGKPVKVIPVINGLLTGDTPSQVAIYTVNRKDGASLPSSVSIDSDGKITVVDTFTVAGNGTYVVTATAKSGTDYTGTKSVEVEFALQFNFVDSVVVNSGADIMKEWGDSPTTLSVDVVAQGNAATGVTWTSATPTVATVDVNGVVTIVGVGQTTITATSSYDNIKFGSINFVVTKKDLANLTLFTYGIFDLGTQKYRLTDLIDGTDLIVVPLIDGLAAGDSVNSAMTFLVTKGGVTAPSTVITGVDGKLTIGSSLSATDNNKTYTITANGKGNYTGTKTLDVEFAFRLRGVNSVVVNGGNDITKVYGDASQTLSAAVSVNGTVAKTVTWMSSDATVATVDVNSGELTILKVGTTDIAAISTEDTTKSNDITVTVGKKATGLSISYKALTTVGGGGSSVSGTAIVNGLVGSDTVLNSITFQSIVKKDGSVVPASITLDVTTGDVTVDSSVVSADSGEYKVIATGKGNYDGTLEGLVPITVSSVSDPDISGNITYGSVSRVYRDVSSGYSVTDGVGGNGTRYYSLATSVSGLSIASDTGVLTIDNTIAVGNHVAKVEVTSTGSKGSLTTDVNISVSGQDLIIAGVSGSYNDLITTEGTAATSGVTLTGLSAGETVSSSVSFTVSKVSSGGSVGSAPAPITIGSDGLISVGSSGVASDSGSYRVDMIGKGNYTGTRSINLTITVNPVPTVTSVVVNGGVSGISKEYGDVPFTISVTVDTEGGADKGLTWSSSDDTVATVAASGEVTIKSIGSVDITATSTVDLSKASKVAIGVGTRDVSKLGFQSYSSIITREGGAKNSAAVGVALVGRDDIRSSLGFTITKADGSVAPASITVGGDGVIAVSSAVTKADEGNYAVRVSGKGKYSGVRSLPIILSVQLVPSVISVEINGGADAVSKEVGDAKFQVASSVVVVDGASQDLGWNSSDKGVAFVSVTGEVTIVGVGTSVIRGTSGYDATKSDDFILTVTGRDVSTLKVAYPNGITTPSGTAVTGPAVTVSGLVVGSSVSDSLSFSATGLPIGATLDSATGIITLADSVAVGSSVVTVTYTGKKNYSSSGAVDIGITVVSTNDPAITGTISYVATSTEYGTDKKVAVTDSSTSTGIKNFVIKTGVPGVTINSTTGEITITSTTVGGTHNVTVGLSTDGNSGEVIGSVVLTVMPKDIIGFTYNSTDTSLSTKEFKEVLGSTPTVSGMINGDTVLEAVSFKVVYGTNNAVTAPSSVSALSDGTIKVSSAVEVEDAGSYKVQMMGKDSYTGTKEVSFDLIVTGRVVSVEVNGGQSISKSTIDDPFQIITNVVVSGVVSSDVTFSSSDSSVATIDASGMVTIVSGGTTEIRATSVVNALKTSVITLFVGKVDINTDLEKVLTLSTGVISNKVGTDYLIDGPTITHPKLAGKTAQLGGFTISRTDQIPMAGGVSMDIATGKIKVSANATQLDRGIYQISGRVVDTDPNFTGSFTTDKFVIWPTDLNQKNIRVQASILRYGAKTFSAIGKNVVNGRVQVAKRTVFTRFYGSSQNVAGGFWSMNVRTYDTAISTTVKAQASQNGRYLGNSHSDKFYVFSAKSPIVVEAGQWVDMHVDRFNSPYGGIVTFELHGLEEAEVSVTSVEINGGSQLNKDYGDAPFVVNSVIDKSIAATGELTWLSSDSSVATIGATNGEVILLKAGITEITAVSTEDNTKSSKVNLVVAKQNVSSLTTSYGKDIVTSQGTAVAGDAIVVTGFTTASDTVDNSLDFSIKKKGGVLDPDITIAADGKVMVTAGVASDKSGVYVVRVTGKGNYIGTKEVEFNIVVKSTTASAIGGSISYGTANTVIKAYNSPQKDFAVTDNLTASGTKSYFIKSATPWATIDGVTGEITILQTVPFGNANTLEVGVSSSGNSGEVTQTITVDVTTGNVNTVTFSYPSIIRKTDANSVSGSAPVLGVLPDDAVTTEFAFTVRKENASFPNSKVTVDTNGVVTVAAGFTKAEAGSYSVKLTNKGGKYTGHKTLNILINVDATVTGIKVNDGNNLEVTHTQPTDIPAVATEIEGVNVDMGGGVTWKSVDPNIVSVDRDTGLMRSHKVGSVYIIATSVVDPNVSQSQLVTVLGQGSVPNVVDFYRYIERYQAGDTARQTGNVEAIISATNGTERVLDGIITANLSAGTVVSSVISFKLDRKETRVGGLLITNIPASISITADGKLKISASAVPSDSGYYRITASSDSGYFSGMKQDDVYIQIEDPSWGDRVYVYGQGLVNYTSGSQHKRAPYQVGEDISDLLVAGGGTTGGLNLVKKDHGTAVKELHYPNGGSIHRILGRAHNINVQNGGLNGTVTPKIQLIGTKAGSTTVTWQSYYQADGVMAQYSTAQYEFAYTGYHLIDGDGIVPPGTTVRMAFVDAGGYSGGARGARFLLYGPSTGESTSVSLLLGNDFGKSINSTFSIPYTLSLPPTSSLSRDLTWTTSDASKVTVNALGQAVTVGQGTATLTATLTDRPSVTASVNVTVKPESISTLSFTRWYRNFLVVAGSSDEYSLGANGVDTSTIADYTLTRDYGTLNSVAISIDSSGTIKLASSVSRADEGFYTVTMTGKGDYSGTLEGKFQMKVVSSSSTKVSFIYAGAFDREDNTAQLTAGDNYSIPSLNKFRFGGSSRVYVPAGANITEVLATRDSTSFGSEAPKPFPNIQILTFANGSSTEILSASTWTTPNAYYGMKKGQYLLASGSREIVAGRWIQIRSYSGWANTWNVDTTISLIGVDTSSSVSPAVNSVEINNGLNLLINPLTAEFSKNLDPTFAVYNVDVGGSIFPSVVVGTVGGANSSVNWTSSDPSILSINSHTGEAKPLKPGKVTLTAISSFDNTKSDAAEVIVYEGIDVGSVQLIYPQMVNAASGANVVSTAPVFVAESKNNAVYGGLYDHKYFEFSLGGVYENGVINPTGPAVNGVNVDTTTGVVTINGVSSVHNAVYVITYKSKSGFNFAQNIIGKVYLPVNVEISSYKTIDYIHFGDVNSPQVYAFCWYRHTACRWLRPPVNYLTGATYAPTEEGANVWQDTDGKKRVQVVKGGKLKFIRGIRAKMPYSFDGGPVPFPELELLGFDTENGSIVTYRARLIGGIEGGGAAIGNELGEGNYYYEKTDTRGYGSSSYKQAEEGTYYTLSEGSSDIPAGTWLQVRTRVSMNYVFNTKTAYSQHKINKNVSVKLQIEEN